MDEDLHAQAVTLNNHYIGVCMELESNLFKYGDINEARKINSIFTLLNVLAQQVWSTDCFHNLINYINLHKYSVTSDIVFRAFIIKYYNENLNQLLETVDVLIKFLTVEFSDYHCIELVEKVENLCLYYKEYYSSLPEEESFIK